MRALSIPFNNAISRFEQSIHTVYKNHESTFDWESLHGRFHIIRCLLLVDCMYRFYIQHSVQLDGDKSFYAVLFHDAMREDNGIDLWEQDSADLCYRYLINNGFDLDYARETSALILKSNPDNLEEQLLYDADVLDYNRFFFLPEERHRFKSYRLKFAGPNDVSGCFDIASREQLILLAQDLVVFSETLIVETATPILIQHFIKHYLQVKPW